MVSESLAQELVLVILILLYGTVLARLVPRKFHVYLNISIALVAILLGIAFNVTLEQMGLGLQHILPGIYVAIGASLIITVATLIISAIPPLRHYFLGDDLAHASGKLIAFEAAIRIPLSTALIEEILFRGVLLGLLLLNNSTFVAVLVSAIIFGLWHVFPTINTIESNDGVADKIQNKKSRKAGSVLGVIIVTTIAGLFFDGSELPQIAYWHHGYSIGLSTQVAYLVLL